MDHMVELPAVLGPSLSSLSVEQRDTYTAIIDDIIAKNGGGAISGELGPQTTVEKELTWYSRDSVICSRC
jgi:hypothetical protein